jgi:hypothetical protein
MSLLIAAVERNILLQTGEHSAVMLLVEKLDQRGWDG